MKFYATPNLFVRFTKRHRRLFGKIGFSFDANGEFETDKELLIKLLSPAFRHDEPALETTPALDVAPANTETTADTSETIRHCKKCGFTCATQGELLKHYRESHPKPKEE